MRDSKRHTPYGVYERERERGGSEERERFEKDSRERFEREIRERDSRDSRERERFERKREIRERERERFEREIRERFAKSRGNSRVGPWSRGVPTRLRRFESVSEERRFDTHTRFARDLCPTRHRFEF